MITDDNGNNLDNDKKNNKKNRTLVIILGISIFVITNIMSYIVGVSFYFSPSGGFENLSSDVRDYRKILRVRNVLFKNFDGQIDNNKLLESAMIGMLDSLGDPYTAYLDKEEFKEFDSKNSGEFFGIGIQLINEDGKIIIISVLDNSPAYNAGIKPGDVLLKVSDQEIDDVEKAISSIKGTEFSKETEVLLEVDRKGEILKFNLNREKIPVNSVSYEKIDDKIGYIRFTAFNKNSAKEFRSALENLKTEGLIIDVRSNPGGFLDECVEIASEFLPEGSLIVSTDNKFGKKEVYKAKKGIAEDVKIVILANNDSASASEVLIGALKDNNKAIFVGEKTFGKGLVQGLFEIGDGSGFKVTISKYYTPKGTYINEVGINPDVEVNYSWDDQLKDIEESDGDRENLRKLDPQYQKALEIIREKVNN